MILEYENMEMIVQAKIVIKNFILFREIIFKI